MIGQWTVWPRDFCVFCFKRVLSDGTTMCLARSVESPLCPNHDDCVRGKIMTSGFLGNWNYLSIFVSFLLTI